ncbi:threonine aldolase family protein [Actinoplanes sp. G11-F43]|uniref:threonine aldolase family protein n=1 Tax=Actinoplanes sp. G11-F43 TaxID=3424130 RepID=UPI003D32B56D
MILHDIDTRGFASDNYSGIHPEVLTAIAGANHGHQSSYGADVYTERLGEVFRRHFGDTARAFPMLTGTGANVVALQAVCARWGAVVCADSGHINVDEGGAPEKTGGLKLLPVRAENGKLTVRAVQGEAHGFDNQHRAQPQVVSLSQSTELGTVYTPGEIRAITDLAHEHGMYVHMDGSRLANAAVHLDLPLRALTTDVGVDVLSFGGTKNGLMLGEVVVLLNPELDGGIDRLRKTSMQLASKQRFISAQFIALLEGDLWQRNAAHANAMATRLYQAVRRHVDVINPVESNALFVRLPEKALARLHDEFQFYDWNVAAGEARWMTSFDTTPDDVDRFAAAIREICGEA